MRRQAQRRDRATGLRSWTLLTCFLLVGVQGPLVGDGLEIFEETLELEDGSALRYERGILQVPVHRANPGSGHLPLEFYRFRGPVRSVAKGSRPVPPIVQLRGGPGFEGLGGLLARPGYFEALLAPYAEIADLIVPGQRGFGTSGATPCDPAAPLTLEKALDPLAREKNLRQGLAACRAKWEKAGLDLQGLNVREAASDIAELARALGYEQVQLLGASFGSHWGMAILRDHPDLVARATLTALEGPDHTHDSPGGKLAAVERILAAADRAPELREEVPEGGILRAFRTLLARARAEPIPVTIRHPQTGEPAVLSLNDQDLSDLLRVSWATFSFRWPAWIRYVLDMVQGDLVGPAEELAERWLERGLQNAAYYQMDCASGISPSRHARHRLDPAIEVLGPSFYDVVCPPWDAGLGETFRTGFETGVPALLVHGNWDTATPYRNAEELRPLFHQHHFIHVEGGSHGALREAKEQVKGFEDAFHHWLATGETSLLPSRVELPRVQWGRDPS